MLFLDENMPIEYFENYEYIEHICCSHNWLIIINTLQNDRAVVVQNPKYPDAKIKHDFDKDVFIVAHPNTHNSEIVYSVYTDHEIFEYQDILMHHKFYAFPLYGEEIRMDYKLSLPSKIMELISEDKLFLVRGGILSFDNDTNTMTVTEDERYECTFNCNIEVEGSINIYDFPVFDPNTGKCNVRKNIRLHPHIKYTPYRYYHKTKELVSTNSDYFTIKKQDNEEREEEKILDNDKNDEKVPLVISEPRPKAKHVGFGNIMLYNQEKDLNIYECGAIITVDKLNNNTLPNTVICFNTSPDDNRYSGDYQFRVSDISAILIDKLSDDKYDLLFHQDAGGPISLLIQVCDKLYITVLANYVIIDVVPYTDDDGNELSSSYKSITEYL